MGRSLQNYEPEGVYTVIKRNARCQNRPAVIVTVLLAAVLLAAAVPATAQAEEPRVRLERTISTAHALPGSVFRVCVQIEPLEDLEGVGVREVLPLGWAVHPVNAAGAAFKRSENEWIFAGRLTAGSTIELVYEVTVPPADKLYVGSLPACFEITGTFQATVPAFEIPIPGDNALEVSTALPIPSAVAHLVPGTSDTADRIDLRLDQRIGRAQLDRALAMWSTDAVVPWTEGEIIDLAMMERLTGYYEACIEVDESLPLSIDPEFVAVRTIDTFLPCDSVLLPEGCLDPGLAARQFSVRVEITGSHDAYGIGLTEWFPEAWRVTPVRHPGFVYRASKTEWIYPDRLPAGETLRVEYLVEVVAAPFDDLDEFGGCCGSTRPFVGIVSSGLECGEAPVGGESEGYVWSCLPVLLAISRWDVEADRLDARQSDIITLPQVQRAVDFWLTGAPVPHTCGYTVGYHMIKRIIAYWLAGVPVTHPLPDAASDGCGEIPGDCPMPICPGGGLCHMMELQPVEDFVGMPDPPRVSVDIEGARELTCAVTSTVLRLTVQGGSPPYRYEWWGPSGELLGTTDTLRVVEPGSYLGVVEAVGGCRIGQRVVITQDLDAPQVSIDVGGDLGGDVAEVVLTASILGGRPPFDVRWFEASGERLGDGVRLVVDAPGSYRVAVEGANGCSASAMAEVVRIRDLQTAYAGPDVTLTCAQPEVMLEGSATGGYEPYVYRWTNEAGESIAGTATVVVAAPGTYTLTAIGDDGRSALDTVVVGSDMTPPSVELSASGVLTCAEPVVTLEATVSDVSGPILVAWGDEAGDVIAALTRVDVTEPGTYYFVAQAENGCLAEASIVVEQDIEPPLVEARAFGTLTCDLPEVELTATIAGGRAPISVEWTDAAGAVVGTTETILVDAPGTYTVTAIGANGCSATDTVAVTQDIERPIVSITPPAVLTCGTMSVPLTATVAGGRAPVEVEWTDAHGEVVGTTASIAVGEPGTYTATATGANGCTASASAVVEENTAVPTVGLTASGTITCAEPIVTLEATVSNASGSVRIVWTNEARHEISTSTRVDVAEPGTYSCFVQADNGCFTEASVVVEQDIEPPLVEALASGTLTCDVLEVELTAAISGGRAPIAVEWTDAGGEILGTTETILVDASGTYTVTATGANGCSAAADVVVAEDIEPPIVSIAPPDVLTCAATEVTLTATVAGGRSPIEIEWVGPSGHVAGTTAVVSVDAPGTYTVTATGANGCFASASAAVEQDTAVPTVELSCSGAITCAEPIATLEATVSNVSGPVRIVWTDAAGAEVSTSTRVDVSEPGTYSCLVQAENGCFTEASIAVEEDMEGPTVDAGVSGVLTCATTEVSLTVVAREGRAPYAITWRNPAGERIATTETVFVSQPGAYTVTATGANGCSATDTITVFEDVEAPSVEAFASGELTCATTGIELTAIVTGGRAPYTFSWTSPDGGRIGTDDTVSVSEPGTYTVTVTGANGCSASAVALATQDVEPPVVVAAASGVLTCAVREVPLAATITGGRAPYAIEWTNPAGVRIGTVEAVSVSEPGTYTITVTGTNGCSASDRVTVAQDLAAPIVEATADGVLTCIDEDVTLSAAIDGGRPPYAIAWTDAAGILLGSTETITVVQTGSYTVTVIGVNGCCASDRVVVTEDRVAPSVTASVDGILTCMVTSVTATAVVDGGRPPCNVAWTNEAGELLGTCATLVVAESGTYTVTATGANGCSDSACVVVAQDIAPPIVDLGPNPTLTCAEPGVMLSAVPTGGTGPFAYLWTNDCGETIGTGSGLHVTSPGWYSVTVTGANGCTAVDSVTVLDGVNPPTVDLGPDRMLGCCGATLELVPIVSGGATPYTYEWYNECDVVVGTDETLTVSEAGTYMLIVRTTDGCIASDSVVVR